MEALGASIAKNLKKGDVVCLRGPLGSGKTTLVRGIAKGLGIKEGYSVRSPTFTLVNEYPTQRGTLIHIDLYRVPDFDWSEFLGKGILVLEWCMTDIYSILIEIEILDISKRLVRIKEQSWAYSKKTFLDSGIL